MQKLLEIEIFINERNVYLLKENDIFDIKWSIIKKKKFQEDLRVVPKVQGRVAQIEP